MNNDSAPSAPAVPTPQAQESSDPAGDTAAARASSQEALTPVQKRAQLQTKKKYEFITSLMTQLDVIIYAELCIVYYME
jgi:hypothetical protein